MPDDSIIKKIYRWRVRSAFFVLVAILILSRPKWPSILIGIAVCAFGLLIRAWASGHIKKEKELAVSGPYRYTRNPLYLGNFILGLSIAIGACSWWSAGLFAAYFLVFYPPVIQEEKERMKRLFPEEYADYKKKVPLFFPRLKRRISSNGMTFDGGLYRKNKEFRALIGAAVIWGVLIARMLIF
ncbi:MAG: isoprenylcysteine carboxylmethyltransferase family protein [Candidatus Aminicenantales bacterium]